MTTHQKDLDFERDDLMAIKSLEINSKRIHIMKPVTGADYSAKTVLTNSSWEYVELWLRRQSGERANHALFYWIQAKNFFLASECLPIESRPLTAYYCCMNAAKALLAINGPTTINFNNISHGITADRRMWTNNNIKSSEVIFLGSGVLYELSKYFDEQAIKETVSVYDLLYNIPCIHRAFSITYNCTELFIPVRNVEFIVDTEQRKGWIQFQVDARYANGNSLKNVPSRYEKVKYDADNRYLLRSKKRFAWDIHDPNKTDRLNGLSNFHKVVRKDIHYIYGDTRLWYIKKDIPTNGHILNRNSITLIFAVMHWLSELVRYNPEKFEKMMKTKQNWLVHEFIDNALYHYIDEISCEITKVDIMSSGYRK